MGNVLVIVDLNPNGTEPVQFYAFDYTCILHIAQNKPLANYDL